MDPKVWHGMWDGWPSGCTGGISSPSFKFSPWPLNGVWPFRNKENKHTFLLAGTENRCGYCWSCHTCQITGKPNQVIPLVPLHPIPVIGEPFETIIWDCVRPLLKIKARHWYLFTLMCATTHFPETVPLRPLRAKNVVKALITLFSVVGLPKRIQTDQGSNFMSKVFTKVLSELSVKHKGLQRLSSREPRRVGEVSPDAKVHVQ